MILEHHTDITDYVVGNDPRTTSPNPKPILEDISSGPEFRILEIPQYRHKVLYEARQQIGVDSKDVSEAIGCTPTTYSTYETLKTTPTKNRRDTIIAFYADKGIDISHEDILSRDVVVAKVITKNATLVEARKALELKTEQIAKELGIYASNYSNIENMDIYPGVDLQTRICDFFRSKGVFVLEEELFPEELNYLTKGERPYEPDVVPLDWINKDVLIVNPEEELEKRELKIVVDKVLRSLEAIRPFSDVEMETKGKYEQILRELFGIDTEEYSTKEIGERLELSSTDVRRIRNRALRVLRRPYIAKELRPFYKNN